MDFTLIALYLSILIASAAVIYHQLTKTIPSRLRAGEAPQSPFGLVRADKLSSHDEHARAHGIDIIFVHGLGSNPDTTWGPKDSNWVNTFLPQDIPTALQRDIRIFFYNYDSYWMRDAVQTRLWSLGKGLLDHIGSEIRGTEEERTRSLIFVGHSFGGLIIKQALILASKSQMVSHIAKHTKSIFFLGTPHRGSRFSAFGSFIARALQPLGSNPALLQELAYDSTYLLELHREFENAVSEKLQVVNFFEQRKTPILKVWFFQLEEFCVREQSATYGKVENNIGFPVNHFDLNKFGSKNENYRMILKKLLAIVTPIVSNRYHGLYAVPFGTVASYTERDKLSAEVGEKLRVRHQNASVPYALTICGLGGAGKTQLALKYAEDNKTKYDPILWIDARDEESVRSSFERCASELRLSVHVGATRSTKLVDSPTIRAVLSWLQTRKETDDEWLVIVDNADEFSWGIKHVLPKGNRGSIIITSQDSLSRKLIDGGCEEACVDTLEPAEARRLLIRHLDASLDPLSESISRDCDRITEGLGHLALAIDLAGAYIGNDMDQRQALRRYLADFEKHKDDLLQSEQFCGLSASDKTVWTVWNTTLERIERNGRDKRPGMLLAFLARFRGGVVQDELFRLASLHFPAVAQNVLGERAGLPPWLADILKSDKKGWVEFHYRETCDMLLRYSLLQRTTGDWAGVSMHGLVQWRAMKYEPMMLWEHWHLAVIVAACKSLIRDEANPEFRRHIVTYIPDVNRSRLSELGLNERAILFTYKPLNRVYFDEGMPRKSEKLLVEEVDMKTSMLGPCHHSTLKSMHNLASTYWKQGRPNEANKLFLEVLETKKSKLGLDHASTLASMHSLASMYWKQGRWNEAEKLLTEVIEKQQRKRIPHHPEILASMANLASVYRNQGRRDEAEKLLVEVFAKRKSKLGLDHPGTLASMANLALTYKSQGRLDEAEKLQAEAMKSYETKLGPDHPYTLKGMHNLAYTREAQGRKAEAISLMKECLQRKRRTLGVNHPTYISSSTALARWEVGMLDDEWEDVSSSNVSLEML